MRNTAYEEPADSGFAWEVSSVLQEIRGLLEEKNNSYGNSALAPESVFSDLDAQERLKVRIDDKINRIKQGFEYGSEDTVMDLIGYLVLLKIASKKELNEPEF